MVNRQHGAGVDRFLRPVFVHPSAFGDASALWRQAFNRKNSEIGVFVAGLSGVLLRSGVKCRHRLVQTAECDQGDPVRRGAVNGGSDAGPCEKFPARFREDL